MCHALRLRRDSADGGPPIAIAVQSHQVAARRLIWREGERVPEVPVICQGWAATMLTLSDGRRQILSFLLPGDLVSSVLVFDPVCAYSVEAITDVRYSGFDRAALGTAIAADPGLLAILSNIQDDEAARADQLAVDLGQRDAAERIARLIVNLSERLTRRGLTRSSEAAPCDSRQSDPGQSDTNKPDLARGGAFDFPLRQHHIADATGLTVVHAGKVLTEFRRAGLIEIGDRMLTLTDPDGLRRVADMY
jgi:CRP-like cAMP-binding protein